MSEDFNCFKDWVINQMEESDLQVEHIAYLCKISKGKYYRMLDNPTNIKICDLLKLSVELGVEVHFLLDLIIDFKNNI